MPKIPNTKGQSISDLLSTNIGEGSFRRDGDWVFYRVCIKRLSSITKYTLQFHLNTTQHKSMASRAKKLQKQLSGDGYTSTPGEKLDAISQNTFMRELVRSMVACDIPLYKLQSDHFRNVFTKYTQFCPPSESLARQSIIPDLYTEVINKIREEVRGCKIWVSVDETRDSDGRLIAAVIVRTLTNTSVGPPFLIHMQELAQTNSETILCAVDEGIKMLGDGIRRNDVIMYMTDGAPYMIKSGKHVQQLFAQLDVYMNKLQLHIYINARHFVKKNFKFYNYIFRFT